MQGRPAEKLNQNGSDQCSGTVNADISDRRTSSGNKRLMVFIQPCEACTENTGEEK